jgi:hypothetical protein
MLKFVLCLMETTHEHLQFTEIKFFTVADYARIYKFHLNNFFCFMKL